MALQDVVGFWKQQRFIMCVWLVFSITAFLMYTLLDPGSGLLMMAQLASIFSIVPPLCYLFPSITGSLDLATQTKVSVVMGKLSGCLGMANLLLFDLALIGLTIDCSNTPPYKDAMGNDVLPCSVAVTLLLVTTGFLGSHAWLSFHVAQQANSAQLLLNPVTSGMVQV